MVCCLSFCACLFQIQDIAQDLASQYAQQGASTSSSSSSTAHQSQQQQLVFELNRSGRYLAIKQELRPLLCDLVHEQYEAGTVRPSAAEVQQLHHNLYINLVQELRTALADVAARAAAKLQFSSSGQQQHGLNNDQQQEHHLEQEQEQLPSQQQGRQPACCSGEQPAEAQKLLALAAECELHNDVARCHALHTKRIAVLPSADVSQSGCACLTQAA